jgi:hypothetical protein
VEAACIVERGSWPAGLEALSGVDVSLRSWRRPVSWSGAPGPLSAQLRAEWTSRFAREGGLYRGAGLLARWLRDFARSGRLAALVEAAFIVERGSWPAGFAILRAEWTSRCAREGGPEDRPT